MSQRADLLPVPVELRRKAQRFLLDVVRESDGMFPYSTSVENGSYVNRFDHPAALRYTINSLLGLQAAARLDPHESDATAIASLTSAFLDCHGTSVSNPGDLGLLLVLLAEGDLSRRRALEVLGRIRTIASSSAQKRLTMQEVSWMLWGACAASRAGIAGGVDVARRIADVVSHGFVDRSSGLPRHSLAAYRRGVVSFGAIVYYLRSQRAAAEALSDAGSADRFVRGVGTITTAQGDLGEWPWLIDVRRGTPLDFYPVFAVHQDSMAMLFLLPAIDTGMPVAGAIERSLAWVYGKNELSLPMTQDDPFMAYRSIERAESAPRLRRYLRATARSFRRGVDRSGGGRVRLNPECRSYHLGWILYAWSGRSGPDPAAGHPGRPQVARRPVRD